MNLFSDRKKMLDFYDIKNLIGAEVGVFAGQFSEFLIEKKPSFLYLVDFFENECASGDQDGLIPMKVDLSLAYNHLLFKYRNFKNIKIIQQNSVEFLSSIPDDHLDFVYLDASHDYEGVKKELILSQKKVKNNGLIMGHDYSINSEKCFIEYQFGVKKAVDEFCEIFKLKIDALALDGCTSFCIKNSK